MCFPGDSFQVQVRLQPWYTGASVTVMTMIGAQVGSDRVTFGLGRDQTVWVDGAPSTLSATNTVSDPDDLSFVGGTVVVTSGGFANDGDVLSATTSGTSITATYNSGSETLTLWGTDTLAHYQSVLDSVTLASSNNPTNTGANRTRTVTWQVNDGEAANNLSTPSRRR